MDTWPTIMWYSLWNSSIGHLIFYFIFLKSRILMSVVGFNMHKYTVYSIYAGKHKIIYQSLQMFLKVREGEGALDQEDYSKGEREEDEEGDPAKGKEEK